MAVEWAEGERIEVKTDEVRCRPRGSSGVVATREERKMGQSHLLSISEYNERRNLLSEGSPRSDERERKKHGVPSLVKSSRHTTRLTFYSATSPFA